MLCLKEGTLVKVDFSRVKSESYSLPSKAVIGKIYKGIMCEDGSVLFKKNIGGWGKEFRNWHVPDEGIIVKGDYMIPVSDMMRIREVACGSWQQRISDLIDFSRKDFSCTKEFAEEMIKASTDNQKTVVLDVLKNAGYNNDVEKQKYFENYFDFSEATQDKELIQTGSGYYIDTQTHRPMYIRNGLASNKMEYREIGFGSSWTPVLVKENGEEVELINGEYLKFRNK